MNFSVIQTGGKQYKVQIGEKIKIEKMVGDFKVGDRLPFKDVLLSVKGDEVKIGTPTTGQEIEAEIVRIAKSPKVLVAKYKPKSRYFKKNGHRQPYFEVKILP